MKSLLFENLRKKTAVPFNNTKNPEIISVACLIPLVLPRKKQSRCMTLGYKAFF